MLFMMNVKYTLHNVVFEWDSLKAAINLRKHNIRFELACEAFFDPFVCYPDDDIIRIVSARLVTNTEREVYENQ